MLEFVAGPGDFSRFECVCVSCFHGLESTGVGETTDERTVQTLDGLGLQDKSGFFSTQNVATLYAKESGEPRVHGRVISAVGLCLDWSFTRALL